MSVSTRAPRWWGRFAVFALLILAAGALLLAERATSASSRSSVVWSSPPNAGYLAVPDEFRSLEATVFGPNVRANQDTTTFSQHEPGLAVSRVNTNTVFAAAKDYRQSNVKRVWIYGSTDGGTTWPVQLRMPNLPPTDSESDPVVMARDDGRVYVSCLTTGNEGIFITWTDNNGQSWQPSVPIVQNQSSLQDKDWFAIDNNPASPYYHRMYMMYAPGAQRIVEQHSTDGGLTWSPQQAISGFNTEYTYPVVGSDGTVYNFMMLNWGFGQVGTVQMTKSTNGGVSWSSPMNVATAYQPPSPIRPNDDFRFFSILSAAVDPITGHLYVAWTDDRNHNTNGTEVVYVKSTDGGASWSAVTRLSHDPPGLVRDHITPMITVGADGRLHAFWLDRRLDPNNRLFDSWYSSSTDGGATWEPDIRVSTVSQDLNVGLPCCAGNYPAGDYWGLDTWRDTVYVAWNDSRTGDQDILVSKGLMSSGGQATPTLTSTPVPPTSTPTATPALPTATGTGTIIVIDTVIPTPSSTSTSVIATGTPQATASPTFSIPTSTATVVPSLTPTLTCSFAVQRFADVPLDNTFYPYVQCLSCRGIIGGYPCGGVGEPCNSNSDPYFRPNSNITRGQIAKIVSESAGFSEPAGTQVYEDVPPGSPFYNWINRLTNRGLVGGYPCGGVGEPCLPPANRPYFKPNANATRGQLSKIVATAAGINDPVSGQTYADVTRANPFYVWVEQLSGRGVMGGYPCGGTGEPCDPQNRPYFRWANDVTRGQASKIVANTFFPGCESEP